MNALSLLDSEIVDIRQTGRMGYGSDGQYDFIDGGTAEPVPARALTPQEMQDYGDMFSTVSVDLIKMHLGRLALLKKIGSASPSTMSSILLDMAYELSDFSEMAILLAFKEVKRSEGAWMPELGKLISLCKKWDEFVSNLRAISERPALALVGESA